jgi:hypothetical protein
MKDMPTLYGEWVKAWYDSQRRNGIDRLTDFPIDPLVKSPNDVANLTSITFPAPGKSWPVALDARGFNNVISHLKLINTTMIHHGMPVITDVKLSGQSPHLSVTYNLALYIIPASPPAKADPMIGSDATGAGGGGSGGGSPGNPSGKQMFTPSAANTGGGGGGAAPGGGGVQGPAMKPKGP